MPNFTRIPAPRVKLVDPQTGTVADEWFRFFNNLYTIAYSGAGSTAAGTYGSAAAVPQITVDDFAGITAISNVPIAIDANQIVSGTIASARISGAYTGITGVGTLTLGTWNASTIATGYGGTGLTSYTAGDTLYYATGASLSTLPIGASTYINTSSGTAPQWTNPTTITVGKASNLVGGVANQIPYQTANDTTGYITAPTVANTFLEWSGTTFQWSSNPLGTVTNVSALTLGTTGTDLSSTVANPTTTPVITLNVPTASATNRGALSSTDWSTFNNKQTALVSGTNIKTVNGTSLLGTGDVGTIDVAHGGTNATTASIISFNNITGYTASGATGTTSTNLVFSTSPTLTTPKATTTIGIGNATPSASGAGITFPATQSASTDANTLDDYEEGTWTPAITFGGAAVGVTYTTQSGTYTKCGNVITISYDLILSAKGSSTGIVRITSLPFTSKSGITQSIPQPFSTGIVTATSVGALITTADTTIQLQNAITNYSASLADTNVSATTRFSSTFQYIV